jgi:hypothetical protein
MLIAGTSPASTVQLGFARAAGLLIADPPLDAFGSTDQ